MGILPDQGSTPLSPEKAGRLPTTGPPRESPQVPKRINVSSNGKPRQRAPGLPGLEAQQQHFRLKSCWSQGYSVTGKNKSNSTLHLLLSLTPCSAACAYPCWLCTSPKRMLPAASSQGSDLQEPTHMKMKSCGAENNMRLVRGLQERCDLTYMDGCRNKEFLYQQVCNNNHTPPLPGLKKVLLNPSGEFRVLGWKPPLSLYGL